MPPCSTVPVKYYMHTALTEYIESYQWTMKGREGQTVIIENFMHRVTRIATSKVNQYFPLTCTVYILLWPRIQ